MHLKKTKETIEMHGMRNFGPRCDERNFAGRHGRWGRHHRHGGRHGSGDLGGGDMMRAGRMLAQGDLRLLALALIAEQPRHGYEIIRVLEDKTEGWYAPSPGIVYPTLTYLEEAGYVTAQADGAKKLYTITGEGKTYLEANRDFVDAVLERLGAVGERVRARRSEEGDGGERGPRMPRLVRAALENLRDVAVERLKNNGDTEAKVVEVLARAAAELKKS
jgi:DNA-binding PadR family transcriptional regulator